MQIVSLRRQFAWTVEAYFKENTGDFLHEIPKPSFWEK